MANYDPENWRRVWQNAKENETKIDQKKQEGTQDAHVKQIVDSVDCVAEQLRRQSDEGAPKNKSERRWKKGEVFGLWAAATVGLAAVLVANHDSRSQLDSMNNQVTAMQGQLNEMKSNREQMADLIGANKTLADAAVKQANAAIEANSINRESVRIAQQAQLALIESQRAIIAYKAGNLSFTTENTILIEHWLPTWENNGNTQASGVRLRTKCMTSDKKIDDPFDLSGVPPPSEGSAAPKEVLIAPGCHIKAEIVDAARKGFSFFYLFGDARYRDIYGTEHLTEFCGHLPGDVINSDKSFFSQCSSHNCADKDCPDYHQ